jgi:hypothetical protein
MGKNKMIKLVDIIKTTPGLEYHLKHKLPISENIYRYSSQAFIDLFGEARELWNTGMLELPLPDVELLETTDIGRWGMYEGQKVPLDLPMLYEMDYDSLEDEIANSEFGMNYDQLGPGEKEWVDDEIDKMNYENIQEAEYKGKKVELSKPKRGGPKKFYVYVKDPKTGNVKKVNFGAEGGGQNLAIKFREPGARASFAARHDCANKKDKTTPGYWSCRIPRYWKSLGGDSNFSGFW